ncbi:DUF3604 domain-containing protein [Oceanicoccus sagamiensis]|uniref:DUF3604 domain-containing protein n=1 Tax=Oceanicoccus sagamiensis TaxID=716816 RepID=A0A1X9NCN3_9GAMM|nr:DUF3604 domain-containing protein [Oceanicoccus sagamiensis]ARN72727.1 hypothetical protein BST96_00505 [Oceanicoccus sagamiensis]
MRFLVFTLGFVLSTVTTASTTASEKQLLWGDTHVHTTYSSDAYMNTNFTADPDTAYRYARGLPVVHPYHQARIQIETPLDFLVVADHAEMLGVIRTIHLEGVDYTGMGMAESVRAWLVEKVLAYGLASENNRALFVAALPEPMSATEAAASSGFSDNASLIPEMMPAQIDSWRKITNLADQHNNPGKFTVMIGWEWTSLPGGSNLHRVVITDGDAHSAQRYQPFSLNDSQYPEDLWAWLEKTAPIAEADFIAIPHNSNISKGFMFGETSLRGEPIDQEYAERRIKWEPLAEVTQTKGDSETHPLLSPDDPFADFETYINYIQRSWQPYEARPGDYIRSALKRGLAIEQQTGTNPYQFGVIGSTDVHTALPSAEEANFQGKFPRDSIPANKQGNDDGDERRVTGWSMSASGLTAVWAEENTRSSILAAMKRKEVYATTGPRIRLQFFAGSDLGITDLKAENSDQRGVPMGGELGALNSSPAFLVKAIKDPVGANLDRVQIIKGWIDDQGQSQEQVYDIAWSGERQLDSDGNLPAVENTVDKTTARYSNTTGAAQLATVWQDPDFNPAQSAFYYVRVLQIPTPRHSFYDAVAMGMKSAGKFPDTIQERAYSSPIWYRP